jgi:cytochrome c oxidase subunit 4
LELPIMHGHLVPKSTYYTVCILLAVLLFATVAAAQVDLDAWNVPIALAIAMVKAALIMLFFMHVRYATPLVKLFAAGGFLWLAILLTLTMADYLTRT